MHRVKILAELAKYLANLNQAELNQTEQTVKTINFIKQFPNCFARELLEGHITGSAWLLNSAGNKVLLTHHRKLGIWIQLGGHADGNNDILRVALQEAQEESGIMNIQPLSNNIFDVDIHAIPEHKSVPAHLHYDLRYLLRVQDDSNFVISTESIDLAWIDIKKIANEATFNDSLRRMAIKYLKNTSLS